MGCLCGGLPLQWPACLAGLPLRWAISVAASLARGLLKESKRRIAMPSGKPARAFLATALMGAAKAPFCPPLSRTTPRHSGTTRPLGPIWANLGLSGHSWANLGLSGPIWAPTPFGDRHRGLPRTSSTATVHAFSAALPEGYYIPVTSKSCSLKQIALRLPWLGSVLGVSAPWGLETRATPLRS